MNDQRPTTHKPGFTLIEILTVIAIIGILAAIIVPVAGRSKETAMKRRAVAEMNSIKVAVMQFYEDHRYMPWPGNVKVGEDMWTGALSDQEPVMDLLTGNNPIKKIYLQIPEKSLSGQAFVDPWNQPYRIGMDRNMDGVVYPDGTFGGNAVKEKVLVYSLGSPSDHKPIKTFDIPP